MAAMWTVILAQQGVSSSSTHTAEPRHICCRDGVSPNSFTAACCIYQRFTNACQVQLKYGRLLPKHASHTNIWFAD